MMQKNQTIILYSAWLQVVQTRHCFFHSLSLTLPRGLWTQPFSQWSSEGSAICVILLQNLLRDYLNIEYWDSSKNWTSVSSYSPVNLAFHQESDCVLLLGILPQYFLLELQKIFTLKILETSGSFPWQSCASIHYIFLFKNRQMKTFCLMKEKQLWLAQEFMKAYEDDSLTIDKFFFVGFQIL